MLVMLIIAVLTAQAAYVYHHSDKETDTLIRNKPRAPKYPSAEKLGMLIDRYSLSASLDTFDQLKPGDIVVCVMPLPAGTLHNIAPSHRVRPYIVVEKKNNSIVALSGSSKETSQNKAGIFRLERTKYKVWKNGWIDITRTWNIPNTHVMKKLDQLSRKDTIGINRVLAEFGINKQIPIPETENNLFPGAVLEKEGKYYYCWNVHPVVMLLPMEHLGTFAIRFDHDPYYLDPYTVIGEQTLDDYTYVGSARSSVLKELNQKFTVINSSGHIAVRRRTKASKQTIEEKRMFLYPPGKILSQGVNRVMYLYSKNDKTGYLKHFGITEEEAQSSEPIVNEIPNIRSYKPEDQMEHSELMEILRDAAVRKGKHFLLSVPSEYQKQAKNMRLLS